MPGKLTVPGTRLMRGIQFCPYSWRFLNCTSTLKYTRHWKETERHLKASVASCKLTHDDGPVDLPALA